jgi:hypothetical protein
VEINRDLVRWLLLIALLPIGWPFVKALWRDFNQALREEGGLFGRQPSAREVEAILEDKKKLPDTLVSEPWVKAGEVRKPRLRSRGAGAKPGQAPAARPRGPRGGFR